MSSVAYRGGLFARAEAAQSKARGGEGGQSKKRPPPPPNRSEDKFSWPGKPGLTRLVTDNVDEVLGLGRDLVVEFYSPTCHACARVSPVIHHIAKAFREEDGIMVAQMDIDANKYEEFVQDKDLDAIPLVRVYPAGSSATAGGPEPIDYKGRMNLPDIMGFVKQNSTTGFDGERVDRLSDKAMATTRRRLKRVVRKQILADPIFGTMTAGAPCTDAQMEDFEHIMYSLLVGKDPFGDDMKFRQCMDRNKRKYVNHFVRVHDISEKILKDLRKKRKEAGLPEVPSAEGPGRSG